MEYSWASLLFWLVDYPTYLLQTVFDYKKMHPYDLMASFQILLAQVLALINFVKQFGDALSIN